MVYFRKTFLVFVISVTTFNVSCDKCGDTDRRETKPIYLKLVNETGMNLVDPVKGPYFPDSIKIISSKGKKIELRRRIDSDPNDPIFQLISDFNDEGHLLAPIYLDKKNTDTLEVKYKRMDNKCARVYEFGEFKYNGQLVKMNGWDNILYIVK